MKTLLFASLALCTLLSASATAELRYLQCNVDDKTVILPKQFIAYVNDTLVWQGNFKEYPLRSILVPKKAKSFEVKTGTEFRYAITEPGKYGYWNGHHASGPHTAYFDVIRLDDGSKREPEAAPTVEFGGIKPNPTVKNGQMITYLITQPQEVRLICTAEEDSPQVLLFSGFRKPGEYSVPLPNGVFKPGYYLCRLEGNHTDLMTIHLERIIEKPAPVDSNAIYHIEHK